MDYYSGRSMSSEHENSETDPLPPSEKAPLVAVKFDFLKSKLLFNRSLTLSDNGGSGGSGGGGGGGSKDFELPSRWSFPSPKRHSVRYQYIALESSVTSCERTARDQIEREKAMTACQAWIKNSNDRYELIGHLDEIGSRNTKNWFLVNDNSVRTDRLMSLLPLPPDCVALEELPHSECPKDVLMEILGSLQHPYIYPVLDLGFLSFNSQDYISLVMPFNPRGSLKDLIYKAQWNEPFNKKYARKSICLPISQVQRLGRQILEALIFLRERGFTCHGHLHSGNVIIQNGVARLTGIENGLLGLNSRVNAVMWSKTTNENIDVICFGHLLFEMCAGYELAEEMKPTPGHLQLDLERYPAVIEVLNLIFDSPDCVYPTVEELVLHELFRNIDLREMRGMGHTFKHALSSSTMSLLSAVRKRQGISMAGGINHVGVSLSEGNSPSCSTPSTPRDRKLGSVLFV